MSFVAFIVVGGAAVILNSVEIYLISKRWTSLKTHDQLLLSLASSDFITGLICVSYGIKQLVNGNIGLFFDTFLVTLISAFILSATNLNAIGLERFVLIQYPIKHRVWMTRRKMSILIAVSWIINLVAVVLIPICIGQTQSEEAINGYFSFIASQGILGTGVHLVIFYGAIAILTIRRSRKKNKQINQNSRQLPRETEQQFNLMLKSTTQQTSDSISTTQQFHSLTQQSVVLTPSPTGPPKFSAIPNSTTQQLNLMPNLTQQLNSIPSSTTQQFKDIPSSGTELFKDIPSSGTELSKEIPSSATEQFKAIPSSATEQFKEIPSSATEQLNAKLSSSSVPYRPSKQERSIIWTCMIVVVYFVCSTYPFSVYLTITKNASHPLAVLLLTNNVANPIIYFFKAFIERRRETQIRNGIIQQENTQDRRVKDG